VRFEGGDLFADGRLADAGLARDRGKAAALDHPHEHPDRGEAVHGDTSLKASVAHYASCRNRSYATALSIALSQELIASLA